jgi:hypothetical protein
MTTNADNYRGTSDVLSPREWPVVKLRQGMTSTLTVVLVDGPDGEGGSLPETSSSAPVGDVVFVLQGEISASTAQLVFSAHPTCPNKVTIEGELTADSTFTFQVAAEHVAYAGIFVGDIQVTDEADDVVFVRRLFVEIEPNQTGVNGLYPLSIAEVRLALRDETPDTNYLLDDVEFTDKEIAYCICRPVDLWNETPPQLQSYSYATFPFRYHWTQAVIGELLKLAGRHHVRNDLDYSAGGISVRDDAKWKTYLELGNRKLAEFKEWMALKKSEMNFTLGWGSA